MKRFAVTVGVMCAAAMTSPAVSAADVLTAAEQCYATAEAADPTLLSTYDESEAVALAVCSSEKAQQDLLNPAKACAAERATTGEAIFMEQYGTNANSANAYGKCVSSRAQAGL